MKITRLTVKITRLDKNFTRLGNEITSFHWKQKYSLTTPIMSYNRSIRSDCNGLFCSCTTYSRYYLDVMASIQF